MAALTTIALIKAYNVRTSKSFYVRGKILLLEVLLRAAAARFIVTPVLRIIRFYRKYFIRNSAQQPSRLSDFNDAVGRQWLTNVLRQKNPHCTNITHIQTRQFASGQTGICARLIIKYEDEINSGPNSIVVKMSRPDTLGKIMNMMARLYSECSMYRNTLPQLTLPRPKCYFETISSISNDFLLLLEDASNNNVKAVNLRSFSEKESIRGRTESARLLRAQSYSSPASITDHSSNIRIERIPQVITYMKRVASKIAELHSKYWRSEKVFEMDVQFASTDDISKVVSFLSSDGEKTMHIVKNSGHAFDGCSPWRGTSNVNEFETLIKETLYYPNMHRATMKGYKASEHTKVVHLEDVHDHLRLFGFTLTHGDFHSENILIRNLDSNLDANEEEEEEDFWILDWQCGGICDPVRDIAQLVTYSGLDDKTYCQQTIHEEIVRTWWDAFISSGQPELKREYPFELAFARYKYWCGATLAVLILVCNSIKGFSDGDEKDHTQGWLYRQVVDRFNVVVLTHGDPRENYNESVRILRKMGKDVGSWGL